MKRALTRFARAAGARALHTAAATFGGYLTGAALWSEVDWSTAASATALATLASVVKSVSIGVPEVPETKRRRATP